MKASTKPYMSDLCYHLTSRAFCSACDADIGTGQNSGGHLCPGFCDEWMTACDDIWIDISAHPDQKMPLCNSQSKDENCVHVKDHATSPQEFCQAMGFKVSPVEQDHEKPHECYDGFPH